MEQVTIRQVVIQVQINADKRRIEALRKVNAPECMFTGMNAEIAQLEAGEIKIGGQVELLDQVLVGVPEWKHGKHGQPYLLMNERIGYWPAAKYGHYIALVLL